MFNLGILWPVKLTYKIKHHKENRNNFLHRHIFKFSFWDNYGFREITAVLYETTERGLCEPFTQFHLKSYILHAASHYKNREIHIWKLEIHKKFTLTLWMLYLGPLRVLSWAFRDLLEGQGSTCNSIHDQIIIVTKICGRSHGEKPCGIWKNPFASFL